jgi:hypothetical protein
VEFARAADMAMDAGVPIDAGTATGRPFFKRSTYITDATTIPGVIDRTTPEAKGFTKLGQKIQDEIRPGGTSTAETSGAATATAIKNVIKTFKATADTAYDALRGIERQHTQDVPIKKMVEGKEVIEMVPMEAPTNVTALQAELRPLFERMKNDPYYTPTRQMNNPGFTAIQNLVEGPEVVPLASLRNMESWLGKEQVGSEAAGLRTQGQGLAAHAGGKVRKVIQAEIDNLGIQAQKAYQEGRFAHRHSKRTAELLDAVSPENAAGIQEPIKAFNRLVQPNDANITLLRRVAATAPNEITQLGRAWFEDRFTNATTHGGMEHTARMLSDWDKLGKETKKILFPDPQVLQRVNDIMVILGEWGKSPNPSGTGGINALMQAAHVGGKAFVAAPISGASAASGIPALIALQAFGSAYNVALHSPAAVRALAQGITTPVRGPVRGATIAGTVGAVTSGPRMGPDPSRAWARAEIRAEAGREPSDAEIDRFLAKYPYPGK